MTTLTPEEAVRRVKCALGEMGWPDVLVRSTRPRPGHPENGHGIAVAMVVPDAVFWQAIATSGSPHACWTCWHWRSRDVDQALSCIAGNCTAGPDDPRTPPRELLVAK